MNILIIIQARTGSTRLPGKILLPLAGEPLLVRMVERVRASSLAGDILVATTTYPSDDPVRYLCRKMGVRVFSGHPVDLLDRHYKAALALRPDAVVKIPSDCPLIDPAVIDRVLRYYVQHLSAYDYVSNLHPPSYPDGNDVEILPLAVLETAWREATRPYEREHTTPFVWERPERFRIGNVRWETGLDLSMTHRWTIDYPEDYRFIRTVYAELCEQGHPLFTLEDILALLERRPDIVALNASFAGVNWYRNHLDELRTISRAQTRQEPSRTQDKSVGHD